MKHLILYPTHDYDKLYFFLKDSGFSESMISALRHDEDALKIDQIAANMRSRVLSGQKVEVFIADSTSSDIPFNDIPLEILFENEDLLIVNKQAGIATIPSKRHYDHNLAGAVCKYMSSRQPHFVFRALGRLDKDTSGIVVIAKNQYAATMTRIEKRYEAICHGVFEKTHFDICSPIETVIENGINKQQRQANENGKSAVTHLRVIKSYTDFAHISLTLTQGRTHQIRVHLSSIGHPLVGDSVYGKPGVAPLAQRTLLHCAAAKITLCDNKTIEVSAPLPNDFSSFLNQTQK